MEKKNYILNLSLTHLALRKVAVNLWNEADILPLVKSFRCSSLTYIDTIYKWQNTVENKVKEKVPMLVVPDSLKEELLRVIKPIGPEMLKWRMHHESLTSNSYSSLNILDQLYWTSLGTVDYQKTAEILISRERIDIISSYKLACIYCMEDNIRIIWDKLSKDTKKFFYDEETPLHLRQPELVIFWTYFIKGELAMLNSWVNRDGRERTLYQYAFECVSRSGNKAASEYFFQKLTFEEKKASLVETFERVVDKRFFDAYTQYDFPKEKFCDVIFYLLSQMTEEEHVQVFKKLPYKTLRCFLDWPWQDLFMKAAGVMWSFFPVESYYSLILILAKNRTMTGYNYPKLCGDFFLQAPSHCRNYAIDKNREHGFWFRDLICANNTEVIRLVLRSVDDKCRQEFIICEVGFYIFVKLIEEEKWFLLELLISECRLSSRNKKILKETFTINSHSFFGVGPIRWRKLKFKTFHQLIDNAKVKGEKRIMEDDEEKEQSTTGPEGETTTDEKWKRVKMIFARRNHHR